MIPLSQIRNAEIYISSAQAAAIVKRTYVWVNQNKGRFSFVRKGKKILRYEITSVIKVATELQQTTPIPMLIESGQKYQEAS
ncbi:hypothetical protein [Maribacter sp.]|uniref:hypothetical protein n=1 Tax=Maribacter sp. TaxID=1897614 RepID=UPI0025C31D6E|nr:hypothetical protein [Maribacter sp.]